MPSESNQQDVQRHRHAAGFWVALICIGLLAAAWYSRPREKPTHESLLNDTVTSATKDMIRNLLRKGGDAQFVEPFAIDPVTFPNGKGFNVRGQMTAPSEDGSIITRPFEATIEHDAAGKFWLLILNADGLEVGRDHGKLAALGVSPPTATSTKAP